ncbi:MAG: alpha/beta fold hydrolase [Candidatus Thiodiazotropha sp. (ex Lucina aurantia)]|uniref:Alpha/beta hydrolase family protein n=2 Tax=Candidatus Thiodiazotropha TaxID=1913444 RepID=A0A7Z0VL90_9GAMM|nr:alpha/beta fold hydrolase [Candidatus Thiodiazotropha endolucinida]MBT3010296.1 alpha/beta fold hydrolase [Candidatus Thiodiazotropha sp. (ex Lucina pensylvanica)]MBT3014328.1 alpha/beta fold hydrolase [Candidatus Thiodiazotropha taylori]MBT3038026.1 alpha/beta fold hydrolase [Candidatus Thiodiazotropha sp. (ex Codakia orbicularis)]MBV2102375.1 alpha/beta fold hydrolase [Candidatus Thiodiazotropha sp. (ex Lucina aurantia)]MBT3021866.1 alpha/beta fold hydrolase [Candidatus Thiodiazotropha ta
MISTPVTIKNRNGLKLYGILEQPETTVKDTAILLLSPGIKMRVGPHRMYNKLSKVLVDKGFTVLRYDFYGLGDSEGALDQKILVDVYNSIQNGRYIDDTIDAMDWLGATYNIDKFVLGGLCGGAITGMLAGSADERVKGLIALGLINVFEGGEDNFSKFVTEGQLEDLKKGYISKLTDIDSWKRIITLKSDFRTIFKILFKPIRVISNSIRENLTASSKNKIEFVHDESSNTNPRFAPTFFSMLQQSKKMLLVYSGGDRLLWEFKEKFENIYKSHLSDYSHIYELHTIPDANHILSLSEWEESMHKLVEEWLQKNF